MRLDWGEWVVVLGEEELQEHAKATAEKFVEQQRIKPKTYQVGRVPHTPSRAALM